MSENLRFAQTFSSHGSIPLLTSLFGCFPVEPILNDEFAKIICKNAFTQTEPINLVILLFRSYLNFLEKRN